MVLHSHFVPGCWKRSKENTARLSKYDCIKGREKKNRGSGGNVFPSASPCDQSSSSERARVCVLFSVTVCVLFGVCIAGYFYKDAGWVLDLGGHNSSTKTLPCSPTYSAGRQRLPLMLNERSSNNGRHRVIPLFLLPRLHFSAIHSSFLPS